MHISSGVYVSESLEKNINKVIADIKYGRGLKSYYLVYKGSNNRLECMKSLYFRQKFFQTMPIEILAILDDYDAAMDYIARETCRDMGLIYDD